MASDSALVAGNFEEAVYLKYALNVSNMEAEQQRLARCVEIVEGELRTLVSQCHEPLIDDLQSMSESQRQLEGVKTEVQRMVSSSQRLKHTIEEPCSAVETKVTQLRNMMKTVEVVRQVQRFLSLVAKLQDAMQLDPLRAARALKEIEECLGRSGSDTITTEQQQQGAAASNDLSGIAVVDAHMDIVNAASVSVRTKAMELLKSSIAPSNANVVDCGAALQVFYSLETLPKVVATIIAEHKRDASRLVVKELDPSTFPTASDELREVVLGRVEQAFTAIASHMTSLAMLWKTLHRKRDPLTQLFFASALYPDPTTGRTADASGLLQDFWTTVSSNLVERLTKLIKKPTIHGIMVSEFPRFQRLVVGFGDSIIDFMRETRRTLDSSEAQLASLRPEDLLGEWNKRLIAELKEGFTAHHADRLREKLQSTLMKIQSSIPNAATESVPQKVSMDLHRHANLPPQVTSMDTRPFLKHIATEIAAHRRDPTILVIQLTTFAQGLQQLHQKLSGAVAKVPLTAIPSISSSMTGGGLFHTAVANSAALVSSEVATLLSTLPSSTSAVAAHGGMARQALAELGPVVTQLNEHCAAFSELSNKVITPYFSAAGQAFAKHVSSLVLDGSGLEDDAAMQVFEERLHHFLSHYAMLFDRTTNAEVLRQQLAMSILRRFAATVCVVRPMPEQLRGLVGRRIMELQTILSPLAALDRHKEARDLLSGLRRLFFSPTSGIAKEALSAAVHPIFPILHYFQRVDETLLPSVHSAMRKNQKDLAEHIVTILNQPTLTAATSVWEASERCLSDFEGRPAESLAPSLTAAERTEVVEGCRSFGAKIVSAIAI